MERYDWGEKEILLLSLTSWQLKNQTYHSKHKFRKEIILKYTLSFYYFPCIILENININLVLER